MGSLLMQALSNKDEIKHKGGGGGGEAGAKEVCNHLTPRSFGHYW